MFRDSCDYKWSRIYLTLIFPYINKSKRLDNHEKNSLSQNQLETSKQVIKYL